MEKKTLNGLLRVKASLPDARTSLSFEAPRSWALKHRRPKGIGPTLKRPHGVYPTPSIGQEHAVSVFKLHEADAARYPSGKGTKEIANVHFEEVGDNKNLTCIKPNVTRLSPATPPASKAGKI
jgi:hypothetical protein